MANPCRIRILWGNAEQTALRADHIFGGNLNSNFGGVCWTKFETISSRIQMIKNTNADEAGRNYLSGGMDSPCLG